LTGEGAATDEEPLVFDAQEAVTERLASRELSSIRVTHCGTVRLVLSHCRIGTVFIDGVDRLDLTLHECTASNIDIRNISIDAEDAPAPARSVISIKGGSTGEVHVEQSSLLALAMQHATVRGATFIRSISCVDPDYVTFANASFGGPFYCQLETTSHRPRPTNDYIIDLRQSTFSSITKIELTLGGACSEKSVIAVRGSRFLDGLRLGATLGGGVLDMIGIRVTGRSELEAEGSEAAVLLRSAILGGRVSVRLDDVYLDARSAEFVGGGMIQLNRDVSLDNTVFGAAATVRATSSTVGKARLIGLRNSQAGQLTLIGLDLKKCHFDGAAGLDTLAIDGETDIWPRWKKRRIIADEEDIRHGTCIHADGWPGRSKAEEPAPTCDSVHVASCYRQLRKGLEAAKDFPGSADFYYGEMEMRRWRSTSQDTTSRALLWTYWLTSGYGLKASRALVSLAIVVLLGGVALAIWGLPGAPSGVPAKFWDGLLTAVEFATLRDTSQKLSEIGRALAIPLRLVAPLLFLQVILALRSRIQR
jgi:hypothetical protein